MIAAVRVGEERLGAVANPFHRPADALRRPQRHDFLGIDENLRAEAAADIGRDDAQLVLRRHADEGGDDQPRHVRILRGVPQRERAGAGIVIADRGARLDRVRHQAVVDDVELGDVLGRLERGIDRLGVAEMPLVDRVVGRDVVDLRRAGLLRRRGIGDRGQHRVIDFDFLGGVARCGSVSAITTAIASPTWQALPLASAGCAAIFIGEPSLEWIIQPQIRLPILSLAKLGAGEHRDHAGHRGRRFGVDRFDRGMRVRRANEIGVSLAGPVDVVGVVALAGDEALIFLAAHRGADTGSAHGIALRQLTPWKGNRPDRQFPPRLFPIRRLSTSRRRRASRARRRQSL